MSSSKSTDVTYLKQSYKVCCLQKSQPRNIIHYSSNFWVRRRNGWQRRGRSCFWGSSWHTPELTWRSCVTMKCAKWVLTQVRWNITRFSLGKGPWKNPQGICTARLWNGLWKIIMLREIETHSHSWSWVRTGTQVKYFGGFRFIWLYWGCATWSWTFSTIILEQNRCKKSQENVHEPWTTVEHLKKLEARTLYLCQKPLCGSNHKPITVTST